MANSGGFGGGSWGGGAWGGAGGGDAEQFVYETVTATENLTVVLPLPVVGVQALSPFLVRVDFGHDLDYGAVDTLNPANYVISGPNLAVFNVAPSSPKSVFLQTAEQQPTIYLLTVNAATSVTGDPIDPTRNTALFPGFPVAPTFFATAQSSTKIELVFSTAMVQNAAFSDPASYTLTTISGTPITINSAIPSGSAPIQRVTLEADTPLVKSNYYVVTIDDSPGVIEPTNGFAFLNDSFTFLWAEMATAVGTGRAIVVPIGNFSGEVTSGLLGQPAGQVFFSPALEVAAANSSIQVDEASLCTRAYDVYEFPSLPDPNPFTTFGGNTTTLLNDLDYVLFAEAERLGQARINLGGGGGWQEQETYGGITDGPADATLVETISLSTGGFLNDLGFALFPAAESGAQSTEATTFDEASSQYVDMGNVGALSFTNATPFSLVAWFKSNDVDGALISKQDSVTDVGYSVALTTGGKIRVELVNTSGSDEVIIETLGSWNDFRWHQVVVTYDGSSSAAGVTVYVDAVAQTSTVIEDTLTGSIANVNAFQLAAIDGTNSFFTGSLDDVAVYDAELTSGEVTTIYGGGTPQDLTSVGPTGDLVGYWLMGDGDTFPTLTDNSVNTNDGTMTNMASTDLVVDSPPFSVFTTADNSVPFAAGPTVNINLQP